MRKLSQNSGFFSVQACGISVFRPFRFLARLNEKRLVKSGASFLTRLDPFMSCSHGFRVRRTLFEMYDSIPEEVLNLDGVNDLALNHLLGLGIETGHYYAYVPETRQGERLGLMLFLHGNAGNFRLMIWRWKKLADQLRLAVVAPTYGFGFWGRHSSRIVENAFSDALFRWVQIDPSCGIWLAGLSDGGNGVTRAALVRPWNGLIYLSGTMRSRELARQEFVTRWKNRPVLVVHGAMDHNVSPQSVRRAVAVLEKAGVDVDYTCYDNEDHFLTFGADDIVDRRIRRWVEANRL